MYEYFARTFQKKKLKSNKTEWKMFEQAKFFKIQGAD